MNNWKWPELNMVLTGGEKKGEINFTWLQAKLSNWQHKGGVENGDERVAV